MSIENSRVIKYSDTPRINSLDIKQSQISMNSSSKKKNIIKTLISGGIVCLIIIIGIIITIIINMQNSVQNPVDILESHSFEESNELNIVFEFNTKIGDLKRIQVNQKYREDRVRDGENITTFLNRITNYDIYVINEQNSDEENKYYYDKLYTCAISIQSECSSSTNRNCDPKQRVDLTNSVRRNIEGKRNLEGNNNNDLKDKPIPICLFNITNNDIITSILCPESLPETKIKSIILDLYFFRPPGLKRFTNEDISNIITRKTVGNKKFIRETNKGICDIENGQLSFCTTDMNITTDLENNFLSYDEEAIMNITIDTNNSYIKSKITNLIDESNKTENLNPQIYEEKLNNIIQKMNPYLKYEELFSKDDFYEFYTLSKNESKTFKKRKLNTDDDKIVKKENNLFHLFTPESGISMDVNLFNNIGINSDFMEANSNLYIESNKTEDISISRESSKIFNKIIKELYILSKSGNHLANELYQKINTTLEDMPEKIIQGIEKINELIKYKDLSEVFDSTLSLNKNKYLPFIIIQESTNLKQKLGEILDNVENGGIKQNIKILNQNIYDDYLDISYPIIDEIFNNLNELNKVLSSPKSKLTEISTYYLNYTSSSYISIIEQANEILTNYYKDQYNLISQKFDFFKKEFEAEIDESIKKEMKFINNLYEKIENKNYTIKLANDEDLKTILNNLNYTKNYTKEIEEKITKKLKKEMDIKENGYFISDDDIKSNQESFSKIIEEAKNIAEQLDNDEYIDIKFDEAMRGIKRNLTKILKYMDQQKEELFPLKENVLSQNSFTSEIENNMKNDIKNAGEEILKKIKEENNYYLEERQRVIKEFLDKNKEDLEKIVSNLDIFFSVRKLEELAQLYEIAFNSSLEKTKNEIKENSLLSDEYFIAFPKEDKIEEIFKDFDIDKQELYMPNTIVFYIKRFKDEIASKSKTQGYLTKYNIFKDNFEKSKLYVNEQLFHELLSDYKTFILKIKEIIQVFKNSKMSDKYPDFNELYFIDDHIRIIDNFYKRLNNYISEEIFNHKYISIMNNFKETQNEILKKIINDMESKHKIISNFPTTNDYNYDFCISFKRKKSFLLGSKVYHMENSEYYCIPLDSISNNYLKLKEHSIETDLGLSNFRSKFKEFCDSLNEKIENYTSKINELKKSLIDIETKTINKEYTLDYLSPIKSVVNSLLSNNFGDEIIKSSYNYYQSNIRETIEPLLNNIYFQWNQSLEDLCTYIENNKDDFKSSIVELSNMVSFHLSLLKTNLTNNYFYSIEKYQKSEFNYTISYYYNILLKLVKSSHQYITNNLPSNPIGFNNIINKRKNEVNDIFNELILNIEDSKNASLNLNEQLVILDVAETNFFGINNILRSNELNNNNLSLILSNIRALENNKFNDEYSLSVKFYLENSESGKQLKELYEQVEEKHFLYLNLEQFKKIIDENWIIDQDEFIKDLKEFIYNCNLEIQKELKVEIEKYINGLEQEITKIYTKEEISIQINSNFKDGVKNLELEQINDINKNINDILDKIRQEIIEETKLLKESLNSYNKNFTKIQKRLSNYKDLILEDLETNIFDVINTFFQNMNDKIYTNYYVPGLDEYISQAKNITSQFGEIRLLNASYNTGEIIDNIIKDLTINYKEFVQNEIRANYNETYLKIKKEYEKQNWEKLIIENIDESYNSILFPVLKEVAKYDIGIAGYNEYDLNDNIIKEINEIIITKMNNIKNIIGKTKGNNFEDIKKWKKMDFSLIHNKINEICNSLYIFFSAEGDNEKEKVDNFLKDTMISNFNYLLENIIPSLGNRFFERIINYNENFKISSLYNNLKNSLVITLAYYTSLKITSNIKIKALTKDIKNKIYRLNDFDLIIQEKNKEVLDLLNQNVKEFIENSQEFFISKYKEFFKNDIFIEHNFSEIIREEIIKNLYELEDNFNENYINMLNNYFKENLISSYTKVMNNKIKEMVEFAENREYLLSRLDDFFLLEPNTVLNEINNKINSTLYSIERFNSHLNTFQISENLKDFLNNFGAKNIQPKFNRIMELLDYGAKENIINKIDINSLNYKNFYDKKEFIEKVNLLIEEITKMYINNITEAIDIYGNEKYQNNLEKEINRQSKIIKRRLNRLLTEEEIENDYKEKFADKALDDTFSKILISSNYIKRFIDNYEKFNLFDKILNDNINKLNIAYKKSLKLIKDNFYIEEDINNQFLKKLMNLKNFTIDYYSSINESFYNLKAYLEISINDIYYNINKCVNITYITFSEKYENLSKIEEINSVTDIDLGEISNTIIINSQNKMTKVNYTISQISKKTQLKFKIEYEEEGGIKKPKVIACIINQSRPKKIEFKLINPQESAGDIIENINIEPNDVNFTISVYYSTKSKDLYLTTYTDFESYKYSTELLQEKVNEIENCIYTNGIPLCFNYFVINGDNKKVLSSQKEKNIPRKQFTEESIVHERSLFNLFVDE